jgi:hypothetical protein
LQSSHPTTPLERIVAFVVTLPERWQSVPLGRGLLDLMSRKSRVFRAGGGPRAQLSVDIVWAGPRRLRVSGSVPRGWRVEQSPRRWRDVALEYAGTLGEV